MESESTIENRAVINGRGYFYLTRIHSLLGLVPIGLFLCFHLTLNATLLGGPDKYQTAVRTLHLLEKIGLLIPVEILCIFLPLLFHAVFGVWIILKGTVNLRSYPFWGNYRYIIQRASGVAVFIFIIFHLWQMHWLGKPFGGAYFNPDNAPLTAALAIQSSPLSVALYVLGVVTAVFHLANGLWSASITWGLTVGAKAQKNWGFLYALAGFGLGLIGIAAGWAFFIFQ
jgi:succinate dehydrogenase / fumarate reductase cytochrome b subunit